MSSLRDSLDRTLLLMRDELEASISDEVLLAALTETSIALVSDEKNLRSHSAQSAYVTAALLMARSGHCVYLVAPNVALVNRQPPLQAGTLVEQLELIGQDLLPGISFFVGLPNSSVDLAILLGDTAWAGVACLTVRLNARSWHAELLPKNESKTWVLDPWPIGGMGAGTLGAAEAFKAAMRRLRSCARKSDWFDELFAPSQRASIDLAPPNTPKISDFGRFDCISGGAITNAALYALLRIPDAKGWSRIIEPDTTDLSNLNRAMLFRRSRLETHKASELSQYGTTELGIRPIISRFDQNACAMVSPLAESVLVGVDDIPTRWQVQHDWPNWLGIGATTHFSAMASFHTPELPCAGCLHPLDDPGAERVPTVAFVSFWAGLWLASFFLRHLAQFGQSAQNQQVYFPALRPESPLWLSPIARRPDCPVMCQEVLATEQKRIRQYDSRERLSASGAKKRRLTAP